MEFLSFLNECDELFRKHEIVESKSNECTKKIYVTARNYIGDPDSVLDVVNFFRQKLLIHGMQENVSFSTYFSILDFIRNAARAEPESPQTNSLETDWKSLLEVLIKERKQLYSDGDATYEKLYHHYHIFAYSYSRLKKFGVEFIEKENKIFISEKSFGFIEHEISRICGALGGDNLQKELASRIGKTYNSITGRFMEYRSVELGSTYPAIPFGYLIAIVSKYSGVPGSGDCVNFDNLVALITDLIVVFEIQPYSAFEAAYLKADLLMEFIRKNILYDGYVGIPQVKPSYASSLIKSLHNKFSGAEYLSFGIRIKDVTRTSLALISLAKSRSFFKVDVQKISLKAGIAQFKVIAVMDKLLSVPAGYVNSNLKFPPQSIEIDHYFKPTIKKGGAYIIFPRSIASLGCINAVCNSIGRPNNEWSNSCDSELGYAIEDFLRDEFFKKGITIAFGNGLKASEKFEVDLICETENEIYIFEMKKKGLTREAQSGSEIKIYQDLADSVLASHFQAMRTERILKNTGVLTLLQNGAEKTVLLNGRSVRRISVSLHDFGALQDKIVLQRILTIATHTELECSDASQGKKLDAWRRLSKELRALAIANDEIETEDELLKRYKVPFHDSLFMSVPQIIMVLEQAKDAGDFFKYIESFISMTTGCRDTYTEFLHKFSLFDEINME